MKKLYITLATALLPLTLLLSGCAKNWLDTVPSSALTQEQVVGEINNLEALVEGIHNWNYASYKGSQVRPEGVTFVGASLDMLGDDLFNSVPAYHMDIYQWTTHRDPYGELTFYLWDHFYTNIMYANQIIEGGEKLEVLDTQKPQLNRILGEAYFFRAWSYFYLTQLYGRRFVKGEANDGLGVILRLAPDQNPMPRNTVAECYTQINKDMEMSITLMEKAKILGRKNRISLSVVYGIAARVALAQSEWAKAEEYANKSIKAQGGKLSGESMLKGYNDASNVEWIWAYNYGSTQNMYFADFNSNFSYNFNGHNSGTKFAINRAIFDHMGPKDIRRNLWVCEDLGQKLPADVSPAMVDNAELTGFPVKYKANSATDSRGDKMIMTIAEQYFNLAEAQARQGKDTDAQKTLTTLMKSRDVDYSTSLTGEDLIEEIFMQKRVDLWFDGFRFLDLKRTGTMVTTPVAANTAHMDPATQSDRIKQAAVRGARRKLPTSIDDIKWEFAIPYDEIKAAPELVKQNPL